MTVPAHFKVVPVKPTVPTLDDRPVAEWMAHMDQAFDAVIAKYESLIRWVEDPPND